MIVTNVGRPVAKFPLVKWREAEGYLLLLTRIDVSDVGNETLAEPFYTPLIVVDARDGMKTITIGRLIVFLNGLRSQIYVDRQEE